MHVLPPAGGFIYFGAVPPDVKLKASVQNELPVMLQDILILDWKRDHPILRNLALAKLYVGEAMKLEVPLESEVLVDGLKGPLIVLHREGRGVHLVVAFDLLQSNWPMKVSFPVFMHNALQYLAIGSDMDVREAFDPGATPRIVRSNLQKLGQDVKEIRLSGPGRSIKVPIPPAGDFALPALDKVGVYTTDPPIPQFEQIAVNLLDDNESNLLPSDTPPGGLGETITAASGKSRLELWWWIIACAALPMLLIEWWVYTRRVHL